MHEPSGLLLFSLDTDTAFVSNLAAQLGVAPAPHEHRVFEDGECKLRPLSDPRGRDAYVVHSLFGDAQHSPHDKLFGLLAFIATLFDHGAARVTAVVPYLAYARKDRQTKPFDPLLEDDFNIPAGFAMVDKRRSAVLVSSENLVAGEVKDMTVLLMDDLIASGDTLRRSAVALKKAGAREVWAFAAHGLFTTGAEQALADTCISRLMVTDSVPTFRLPQGCAVRGKLTVATAAPQFARAMLTSHAAWRR